MIKWQEHITSNKDILQGKPVIKNTRLSVAFILERLASGWTENDLIENYPKLTQDSIKAVYSYLHECMKDGLLFIPKKMSA